MMKSKPPSIFLLLLMTSTKWWPHFCWCNQVRMMSLGWALIQHDCCPYKKGKSRHRHRCTQRRWCWDTPGEDSHVTTVTEIRVMHLQTKGCQRLHALQTPEERRGKKGFFPMGFGRSMTPPPTPWFWTSSLQNLETIKVCCFKLLSLWSPRKLIQTRAILISHSWIPDLRRLLTR